MNPVNSLLRSRKFLLMLVDVVISLILYFGGKYLGPAVFEDINTIIVLLQPVIISVIVGIAIEDSAEKSSYQYIPSGDEIKPMGE
jgi:hypothetical protein